MRRGTHRHLRTLSLRVAGFVAIVVVVLSGVGLDPFGAVSPDRPWSRCGQDLCACQPLTPIEPFCPLCPTGEVPTDGACSGEGGCGPRLVRQAERLGGDLPMIAELLSVSLVIGIGSPRTVIAEPSRIGFADAVVWMTPASRVIVIEPGPPRVLALSA